MVAVPAALPSEGSTLRAYAAAYVALGWSVIPMQPGAKAPSIRWAGHETARATLDDVDKWLHRWPSMNLGVVTGPISGVAVLDLDGAAGIEALRRTGVQPPKTLLARSPHGWHAFYALNGKPVRTVAGVLPSVDIRGTGGCIVVAPSRRPDGVYRWHSRLPLAPVPEWMEEQERLPALAGATQAPRSQTAGQQRDSAGGEQWIVSALANGVPNGQRNATATRLAGYLHAKRLPGDVIVALMGPFAARCSPPIDDRELWTIVASVSRYAIGGRASLENCLPLDEEGGAERGA